MMKKILVPVDFSDTSLNALNYTINLVNDIPAEITLLHTFHVMRSSAFSMKIKSINKLMEEDAQREMNALLKKIEKEGNDIVFKSRIVSGGATSTITKIGDSGEYDLIIMGTKGASGLKEVFIGSVAGWVISKTRAPVIVVPDKYIYQPLKEIVFAISGDPVTHDKVLDPLRKMARMKSSSINLLHISEEEEEVTQQEEAMEKMVEILDEFNPTLTFSPGDGDVNECLNNFIKDQGAGLLCLVREKKGFFNRLFFESVTLKQTFHTQVPLLVLHN